MGDRFKEHLKKLHTALEVLHPSIAAQLKLYVCQLEKATVSLKDFVYSRRWLFFFYEVYRENFVRFGPYFKDIIRGLIHYILKNPGSLTFKDMIPEELELVRYIPSQLTEPMLIASNSVSGSESFESEDDMKALWIFINHINGRLRDVVQKYQLCPLIEDFMHLLHRVSNSKADVEVEKALVMQLIAHPALKDHLETITFVRDVHSKVITDDVFRKRFLNALGNQPPFKDGIDLKSKIPENTILHVVFESSFGENNKEEGEPSASVVKKEETPYSKASQFVFYSLHLFEHGKNENDEKKVKAKGTEEETKGQTDEDVGGKNTGQPVWSPRDLVQIFYDHIAEQLLSMYKALIISGQLNKIETAELKIR